MANTDTVQAQTLIDICDHMAAGTVRIANYKPRQVAASPTLRGNFNLLVGGYGVIYGVAHFQNDKNEWLKAKADKVVKPTGGFEYYDAFRFCTSLQDGVLERIHLLLAKHATPAPGITEAPASVD